MDEARADCSDDEVGCDDPLEPPAVHADCLVRPGLRESRGEMKDVTEVFKGISESPRQCPEAAASASWHPICRRQNKVGHVVKGGTLTME